MSALLFELEFALPLFAPLLQQLGAEAGVLNLRRFPDGESYLRVDSDVKNRACIILVNFSAPDDKFLQLCFLAATLKEMGASSVGLVAPYLCYMRQDVRFADGEAITSRVFAQLISQQLDWLVTVDPHLHRYHNLEEIYSIPAIAVKGAPVLAHWLAQQNEKLLLVGPDSESEQWVKAIAEEINQPFVVGTKERRGDRDVTVTLPDLAAYKNHTAVIIDDVIASGHTILRALLALWAGAVALAGLLLAWPLASLLRGGGLGAAALCGGGGQGDAILLSV